MSNVKKPDVKFEVLPTLANPPSLGENTEAVRRWPIIRGRTWRLVIALSPLKGVHFELERTDHAQF